jgi:hypothetical protein
VTKPFYSVEQCAQFRPSAAEAVDLDFFWPILIPGDRLCGRKFIAEFALAQLQIAFANLEFARRVQKHATLTNAL